MDSEVTDNRFDKAVSCSGFRGWPQNQTWLAKGMRKVEGVLLLGSLLVGRPSAAFAEVQLEVGTSTTLPSQAAPTLLPPPPVGVRQIREDTDPEQTADMPLSLLAEQVLEAVCEAQIDAQRALALMPDLSESHIRAACPKRLIPKS